MKYLLLVCCWSVLLSSPCWATEQLVQTENDKINYSIGWQIGGDLRRQSVGLNPAALVKGIEDALAGSKPLLSEEEMRTTLVDLKKRIVAAQQKQRRQAAEKYRGEGREFLARNSEKEGVKTLPSGLQYKILKEGTGRHPMPEDKVTVRYRGRLIDGTEFDSSYRDGKPATFRADSIIPGWREALPLMKEGAKWELFVPADLAFGERGPLADRTVIYDIELLKVQKAETDSTSDGKTLNSKGTSSDPPLL